MAIVKVEKQYPRYIFYTSSNRAYIAEVSGNKITFYTTVGTVSKSRPAALREYDDFFTAITKFWPTSGQEQVDLLDAFTSLPNFDYEHFVHGNFNRFYSDIATRGLISKKQCLNMYREYGNRLFDETFFISEILPKLHSFSEEEVSFLEHSSIRTSNGLFIRFCTDKKFRHLLVKAYDNSYVRYRHVSIDIVARAVDKMFYLCDRMSMKIPTGDFWKNLHILEETWRQRQAEFEEKLFCKTQTEYNLAFEDDNFIAVVPTTYRECANEGEAMHNCVASYEWTSHLSKGTRRIVFIRRKSEPNKPFVDWDMSLTLIPIQIFTHHNTLEWTTDRQFAAFKKAYCEYLREIYLKKLQE